MKINKYLLAFCLTLFSLTIYSQAMIKNAHYGFSMEKPKGWIEGDNKVLLKNLEKYEINDDSRTKILKNHKGTIPLAIFYKYNPKNHAGLIPTIQVNIRGNDTKNFQDFVDIMTGSANSMADLFEDFEFIKAPSIVTISGIKSFYFVAGFTMQSQLGESLKVRTATYAIPCKDYFIQLNFTDSQDGEDCRELFKELLNSVKIK